VAASTIPAEGSQAGFDAALAQWKIGAAAISAGQGQYWTQAKADLQTGRTTDSPTTGYASAISELAQLISLPDADMTPTQNSEFNADMTGLDTFFHTPGLYT
jgi:hypothetical protein